MRKYCGLEDQWIDRVVAQTKVDEAIFEKTQRGKKVYAGVKSQTL